MVKTFLRRNITGVAVIALLGVFVAQAATEIKVVTSGTFTAAYLELVPDYERSTHNKITTEFGGSMGTSQNAIPMRLNRGEAIDVVIMAAPAMDDLIKKGKIQAGSRIDLVRSKIGMIVKAGAPKPDISTLEALKHTLLAAKSIALSESASGVYLFTELFPKLGIADQTKGKIMNIDGSTVAAGKAEIGFQQLSELRTMKGVDVVGELPPGAQRITVFSAGIPTTAQHPEEAKALIQWLASPVAYAAIARSGLEPAKKSN